MKKLAAILLMLPLFIYANDLNIFDEKIKLANLLRNTIPNGFCALNPKNKAERKAYTDFLTAAKSSNAKPMQILFKCDEINNIVNGKSIGDNEFASILLYNRKNLLDQEQNKRLRQDILKKSKQAKPITTVDKLVHTQLQKNNKIYSPIVFNGYKSGEVLYTIASSSIKSNHLIVIDSAFIKNNMLLVARWSSIYNKKTNLTKLMNNLSAWTKSITSPDVNTN